MCRTTQGDSFAVRHSVLPEAYADGVVRLGRALLVKPEGVTDHTRQAAHIGQILAVDLALSLPARGAPLAGGAFKAARGGPGQVAGVVHCPVRATKNIA